MAHKGYRKLSNLDPDVVKYKRHIEKKTLEDVAQELRCSVMSLSRYCRENNIENPILEKKLMLDLTGRQFGFLKVIRPLPKRSHCCCIIWECQCNAPGCNNMIERASNVLMHGAKTNQSCGCFPAIHNYRGVGDLSGSYYNSLRRGATVRSLVFTVSKEQLWNLFEQQDRRCALSGVELCLSRSLRRGNRSMQTASVDRIDSSKGYTIDNVQWIHKHLQFMKSDLTDAVFVEWCRRVVNHHPFPFSAKGLPLPTVVHE